ncbi:MAG: hypothetical protein ED557_09835 [Balneola sp.]|nr:MAG: hypothetical protein ED557_09835 [Balneola sp.]
MIQLEYQLVDLESEVFYDSENFQINVPLGSYLLLADFWRGDFYIGASKNLRVDSYEDLSDTLDIYEIDLSSDGVLHTKNYYITHCCKIADGELTAH